jgi:hypothetical protein
MHEDESAQARALTSSSRSSSEGGMGTSRYICRLPRTPAPAPLLPVVEAAGGAPGPPPTALGGTVRAGSAGSLPLCSAGDETGAGGGVETGEAAGARWSSTPVTATAAAVPCASQGLSAGRGASDDAADAGSAACAPRAVGATSAPTGRAAPSDGGGLPAFSVCCLSIRTRRSRRGKSGEIPL